MVNVHATSPGAIPCPLVGTTHIRHRAVGPVGGTPCRGRQPTAGGVLSFGDVAADVVPGQVSEVTVVGINPVHGKRTPLGKISVSLIGCGWNDRFLVCPAATSRCGASPGTEAGLLGAPANTPFAGAPDRHAVTVIWIGPVLFDRSGSTASPVTVNAPSAPTDGSVMRRISVPKNAGPPAEAGSAGVQRYSLGDTGAQMSGALTNWVPVRDAVHLRVHPPDGYPVRQRPGHLGTRREGEPEGVR